MTGITRRTALQTIIATSASLAYPRILSANTSTNQEFAKLAKYVHPKVSWSYAEFNEFLDVLPDTGLESIQKALELNTNLTGNAAVKELKKEIVWHSNNILTYGFRDEERIGYHDLVKWVGSKIGVDQWILDTQPTLVIERAIQEKLFVDIWDKLNQEQRSELLKSIDRDGRLIEHVAAIASMSGAGALGALSVTVHLTGFAFYTTMSTVICTVAGWFGVTLPFAAYTTASSVVAFLSGPVGWALLAIAFTAGVAIAGRATPKKATAAICQMHALKVAALQAANERDETIFAAMGDPTKRQLVGRWDVGRKEEIIELALASDGTFTAKSFRVPATDTQEKELLWDGKGIWSIRDDSLSVRRTHTWSRIYWASDVQNLYKHKILNITPTHVELADNVILHRR